MCAQIKREQRKVTRDGLPLLALSAARQRFDDETGRYDIENALAHAWQRLRNLLKDTHPASVGGIARRLQTLPSPFCLDDRALCTWLRFVQARETLYRRSVVLQIPLRPLADLRAHEGPCAPDPIATTAAAFQLLDHKENTFAVSNKTPPPTKQRGLPRKQKQLGPLKPPPSYKGMTDVERYRAHKARLHEESNTIAGPAQPAELSEHAVRRFISRCAPHLSDNEALLAIKAALPSAVTLRKTSSHGNLLILITIVTGEQGLLVMRRRHNHNVYITCYPNDPGRQDNLFADPWED